MATLTAEEKSFFELVTGAALANPFSDERTRLDLRISGLDPDAPYDERLRSTIAAVSARVDRLEADGRANIADHDGREQTLVVNALLFDMFHRFMDDFDRYILEQMRSADAPPKVPFARDALALLRRRGFDPDAASRYFALCFQLRRAFFFIHQNLVGCSLCMKELRRKLWNNVFTCDIDLYNRYLRRRMEDFSTLLLGETGTGKGTAAGAIGRSGFIPFNAATGRFVENFPDTFIALNLSQFPESLMESELFGHRKGAFTGAVEAHKGVFDRCSRHGAIFLDEIGEVAEPVQIKLLHVLQERTFSPVGGHDMHRFEGRVIAATNRALGELRGGGRLRDDFYYRLCSDVITVPPLRRRIMEDPQELDDLLAFMTAKLLGAPSPDVVAMVRDVIDQRLGSDYPWPGNVRELEQCVRRVLLNRVYDGDRRPTGDDMGAVLTEGMLSGRFDASTLLCGYCALLHDRLGTYEAVARRTNLDRRTVKKYIDTWRAEHPSRGIKSPG